jgi:hypothetical protein
MTHPFLGDLMSQTLILHTFTGLKYQRLFQEKTKELLGAEVPKTTLVFQA